MGNTACWLFVDHVPLLFEKEKVLKQLKVETWLDLTEVLKEAKENLRKESTEQPQRQYIV